jgi:predicted  nucleic acid-binding Zn-ribbon protein
MAARTNSEKIEVTEKEVLRQSSLLQSLEERYRDEVGDLQNDIRRLTEKVHELTVRVATLEQRVSHLEKLLDEGRTRRWQVWLAFMGAFLSAAVALTIAFAKK